MDDVYNNIDYYNPNRNRKILIAFDDMIADMMTNNNNKISCFHHTILFFCSKRSQIKLYILLNNED